MFEKKSHINVHDEWSVIINAKPLTGTVKGLREIDFAKNYLVNKNGSILHITNASAFLLCNSSQKVTVKYNKTKCTIRYSYMQVIEDLIIILPMI